MKRNPYIHIWKETPPYTNANVLIKKGVYSGISDILQTCPRPRFSDNFPKDTWCVAVRVAVCVAVYVAVCDAVCYAVCVVVCVAVCVAVIF